MQEQEVRWALSCIPNVRPSIIQYSIGGGKEDSRDSRILDTNEPDRKYGST